jgi:hypothetical protein
MSFPFSAQLMYFGGRGGGWGKSPENSRSGSGIVMDSEDYDSSRMSQWNGWLPIHNLCLTLQSAGIISLSHHTQ